MYLAHICASPRCAAKADQELNYWSIWRPAMDGLSHRTNMPATWFTDRQFCWPEAPKPPLANCTAAG